MASKFRNPAILRSIVKRNYGAEAAPKFVESASSNVSVLPTKIVVASAAPDSPLAEVSISFKAGSRYESGEFLGVSHFLRSVAGLGTEEYSPFAITRNLQHLGCNLSASTDREIISYTLQGNKDNIEQGINFLISVATKQAFKPWELKDNAYRLKYDLLTIDPQAKLLDLAHKAAFQSGLGNSLYLNEHRIGQISPETLQHYVKSYYAANRASVTGVGVSQDVLTRVANALPIESSSVSDSSKPVFYQNEERLFTSSNNVYVALVGEGSGLNKKETYAFAALQYALGAGPQIKYGSGISPLSKAATSFKEPVGIAAFNLSYSDTGLFGVSFVTSGQQGTEVAQSAVKILKSGNVSNEDAKRGIAQLTAAILLETEEKAALNQDLRVQATTLGAVHDAASVVKAVSSVTPSDVQSAAKKIASGKLALAAVGNTSSLPYVDVLVK